VIATIQAYSSRTVEAVGIAYRASYDWLHTTRWQLRRTRYYEDIMLVLIALPFIVLLMWVLTRGM